MRMKKWMQEWIKKGHKKKQRPYSGSEGLDQINMKRELEIAM